MPHDGRDRLDECDLLVGEAAGRSGPVEVKQPPAAAAGGERRAQLRAGVYQRPQPAPPRAALGTPAGRGVQVGDLPRAVREVGELVEVRDLELVLPERGADRVREALRDTG